MQTISPEQVSDRYERLLQQQQRHHGQIVAAVEDFHLERYAEILDILQAVVALFDGLDTRAMLTLTALEQQHRALMLGHARRYLKDAEV